MTATAPMAVTHVSPFGDYDGEIVFSGAENHLFQLMAGQQASGLDVELMMLVINDGPRLREKAGALQAAGIRVTRIVYDRSLVPLLGRASWVLQMPRLIAHMRSRRSRIIHTHQPHASQLGRLAARLAGAPWIVDTVHNDEPQFAKLAWRIRLRALERITPATIAISERVRQHLVDNVGLQRTGITVIPYGIDAPGPADRRAARATLGLSQDGFVVGFVGRLVPQKDLGTLLAAMREVEGAELCIVGAGPEEQRLRTMAAGLGLDRVIFAGQQPNGAELMAAFDVFALSSRWEGLGLVLLEAMSRGVPIAATRGGAIPEVLADGELGLLSEVGDTHGLAVNISRLRTDQDLYWRMVDAGKAAVALRYSISAMTNATTAVYEAVRSHA